MSEWRSRSALVVASVLTLVCAVVAGVAANSAVAELTRGPNAAEVRQAASAEVAGRWRAWPAGRIFPATLAYTDEQGGKEKARRVGISSGTDCGAAVDGPLQTAVKKAGCRAILRATYLDALQGVVVTVGVAAFPDTRSAAAAEAALPRSGKPSPGLRALAFKGTVTDRFTAAARQAATLRQAGPYVVLTTAGQVDGRPARALGKQRPAMFSFTEDLSEGVADALTVPSPLECGGRESPC
ncbi:hypothetical protein [Planotetraspora kaengkrachanensis]|uniref:Uncharacterized protein n=1 Tax=Planotetraspora kaengkrachanensis TaxID=575193 RepID=A0A8J3PTK9_9ACTN|nr:hypothetical protein [Planotetraspora kaengkrachanensis]GIG80141.1 hypothetical protein Pka01_32680 [Planotetraspora kaengkrachanensis]